MPSELTPATLAPAVQDGYTALEADRAHWHSAIKEYAGANFGKSDGIRRPINLIAQGASILLPNLISDNPKHKVRTPLAELRSEASMLELALDRLWQDAEVVDEVRAAVLDAILGPIGLIRVGMRAGTQFVTVEPGHNAPVAEPFCRRISLDDYSCDPTARSRRELRWEAIRYRIPRQEAIEANIFGRDPQDYAPGELPIEGVATRKKAAEILAGIPAFDAATGASEDAAQIARDRPGHAAGSLIDTIELWDVFLYLGTDIWTVTIPATHQKQGVTTQDKWLLAEPWEGPETGPLLVVGFCDVPDQVLYKPLVADWRDLHDLATIVSDKLGKEAKNAKKIWPYQGDQEDDMMSVREAADSGTVRVTGDPSKIKPLEIVGIVKELFPLTEWIEKEWANASGNLPLTGGQNSDATDNTATAAQYLQANASQRIRDMRSRVEKLLQKIDEHFGWYLTTDPLVKLPLPYRVAGGETITRYFDASERRGDFTHYSFEIERYSSIGMDPNVRLKRVTEFLGLLGQMVPLLQMGLVTPQGLATLGRQEFGIENIDELLPQALAQGLQMQAHAAMQGMQPPQGQPPQETPGMNPQAQPARLGSGGQQNTPIDAGRSAMSVGVGA